MGLFSKRTRATISDDDDFTPPEPPPGVPGVDRDWDRAVDGPFDISEVRDKSARLDLGAIAIPAMEGMELQVNLEEGTHRMTGATCIFLGHSMQVQAFAAPRSSGIWDDIRGEIVTAIQGSQGAVTEQSGVLGHELITRLPSRTSAGDVTYTPARFFGIDGPKWFLRAVLQGPAARDEAQLAPFAEFLRGIIVDRGDEPRPPRELLALTPPKVQAAPQSSSPEGSQSPDGPQSPDQSA